MLDFPQRNMTYYSNEQIENYNTTIFPFLSSLLVFNTNSPLQNDRNKFSLSMRMQTFFITPLFIDENRNARKSDDKFNALRQSRNLATWHLLPPTSINPTVTYLIYATLTSLLQPTTLPWFSCDCSLQHNSLALSSSHRRTSRSKGPIPPHATFKFLFSLSDTTTNKQK